MEGPKNKYGKNTRSGKINKHSKKSTSDFSTSTKRIRALNAARDLEQTTQNSNPDNEGLARRKKDIEAFQKFTLSEENQKMLDSMAAEKSDDDDIDFDDDQSNKKSGPEKGKRADSLDEVLAEGKKKGYPNKIDRDEFESRVLTYLNTAEQILKKKVKSEFYNSAQNYAEGSSKSHLNRIDLVYDNMTQKKGYYGYKGVEYISSVLQDKLLPKLNELKRDTPWMQKFIITPIIFELIIIPEITIRLIMDDKDVSYERANSILQESNEYGERVFRVDDDHISDEDDDKKPTSNHVESDSDDLAVSD